MAVLRALRTVMCLGLKRGSENFCVHLLCMGLESCSGGILTHDRGAEVLLLGAALLMHLPLTDDTECGTSSVARPFLRLVYAGARSSPQKRRRGSVPPPPPYF
jgi:hypothetical protein